MIRQNYLKHFLLFLLLCWVSALAAQNLRLVPEWKKGPYGTDEDGNKILYWQDFEEEKEPKPQNTQEYKNLWEKQDWITPIGWEFNWNSFKKSSNNVFIRWLIKAQGANQTPFQSHSPNLHLRYDAHDEQAFTGIYTPVMDLRKAKVESPTLKFWFAAPKRTATDALIVKFKTNKFGEHYVLETYNEAHEDFVLKTISLAEAFKKFSIQDKDRGTIQIMFEGHLHLGGGLNIDDVMIVEVAGNPSKLGRTGFVQLTNPVGTDTKLNEIARVFMEITSGAGYYKVSKMKFNYKGDNTTDVEKFYLYHTTTPYFSSQEENKLCDLTLSGTELQISNMPTDDKAKFRSGEHYFWVVADLKASAELKHKVTLQLPKDAVELQYYADNDSPLATEDRKFPDTEQYDQSRYCRVYKCLAKEDFENNNPSWTLTDYWKIGEPVHDAALTKFKTAPTKAFNGKNVLATAQLYDNSEHVTEKGHLDGQYTDGLRFENTRATYSLSAGINAEFYRDIRFKARYCLNSTPDDKFRLVIITDKDEAHGIPRDIETVVWDNTTRTTMIGWNTLDVDLSLAATRNKKFRFRFEMETKDDEETQSGLFIDDIQILGDYIKKDIGIVKVEPPQDFPMSNVSKVKITVKNFGSEDITGGYIVYLTLNGKKTIHEQSGTLAKGAEQTIEISGLELAPDPNKAAIANEKQLTVEVALSGDKEGATSGEKDDDKTNNVMSVRFYSFPVYEIEAHSATKKYPLNNRFDRLLHWFPEALTVQYTPSWVETFIDTHEKFKNNPLYANVPYSYRVWTTGLPYTSLNEKSTLTGPIFDLQGSDPKEFIVGFVYEKEQTQTNPSKFWFEYRTDTDKNWKTLTTPTTTEPKWSENWYTSTKQYWELNQDISGFKVAKVQLPLTTGKIQIRAHFEAGAEQTKGITISGFEVREIRPDLEIAGILPTPTCERIGAKKLQIQVKNNGPVDSKAFSCPATVRVYEYLKESAYTSNNVYDDDLFRLRGEHLVALNLTDLTKGAQQTFDTDIEFPWDVSDWGYKLVIELHPETTANKQEIDENALNNTYQGDIVSKFPYFPVIKNLLVQATGTNVYYVRDFPQIIQAKIDGIHNFQLASTSWTLTPGEAEEKGSGMVQVNKETTLTLKYALKYKYPKYAGQQCENLQLQFQVKKNTIDFKITKVEFLDQENPEKTQGCYKQNGEKVKVTVTTQVATKEPTLDLYINGAKATPNVTTEPAQQDKTYTLFINDAKFPKGYSQVEIVAVDKTDHEDGSVYVNNYHADSLFRADPQVPTVYWRNKEIQGSIQPVPKNAAGIGYVSNYVGRLELYVPPVSGATYQWYKGNPDATTFEELMKMEGQTINYLNLSEESATYGVKVKYGTCGEQQSMVVVVRTDDLELVAFTGIAATGICESQGQLPLEVDIRNNSRTEYKPGTKLRFKLKITNGHPSEKTYDVELQTSMTPQAVNTILIANLSASEYEKGDNTFELEFLGILSNGSVVPDGNKENNKLIRKVSVLPSPTVSIMPATQNKIFTSLESYTITPTYGGDPAVKYVWSSKNSGDMNFTDETAATPNFTVTGAPKDQYRITAHGAAGCTAEATVTFIQTDLEIANIISPASACDLSKSSFDYVEFLVKNTGSKDIEDATDPKIKVKITLDNNVLKEVSESILTDIRKVGNSQNYRISVEGLKEKLKTGDTHTLKVEIDLEGATDVNKANNTYTTTLRSYGDPVFDMKYNLAGVTTPITPGQKIEYYSSSATKFSIEVTPDHNEDVFAWQFGPDNTISSIVDILKGTDEEILGGTGTEVKEKELDLPNAFTKMKSLDRLGSGFYYLTVRTPAGCSVTKHFELQVIRKDIAVSNIEPPKSACSYSQTPKVGMKIKNLGNQIITRGTKFKLTVTAYKDEECTQVAATYKEENFELEQDLLVNNEVSKYFDCDVIARKASGDVEEFDGKSIYFAAEVEFVEALDKDRDFDKTNNKIQFDKTKDPNKNFVVTNYKDVTITSVKMTDRKPSSQSRDLLNGGTEKYDLTYENGGTVHENYVTLKSTENDCEYQWGIGYGLIKLTDAGVTPSAGQGDDLLKQQMLYLKGAGIVSLTVVSKKEGNCAANFLATIVTEGGDLFISELLSPARATSGDHLSACLDGAKGKPITFKWKSAQDIDFPAGAPEQKIKFVYSLKKENTTNDILGSHGEYEFTLPRSIKADTPLEVTLKDDNGQNVTVPEIPQPGGKYILSISFNTNNNVELKKYNQVTYNDKIDFEIDYHGAPTLDLKHIGGASQDFYTEQATIELDPMGDPNVAAYTNFQWTFPDGTLYPSTGPASNPLVTVSKPGTYKLTFDDKDGCHGVTEKTIHFPGYLQFAPQAIVSPIEGCELQKTQPTVTFKVTNHGKEDFTIKPEGIPVEIKIWDATGTKPATYQATLLHGKADPMTIAPGETKEVTTTETIHFDDAVDNRWNIELNLHSTTDGSHTVAGFAHPTAEATVRDNPKPKKPDLAKQARDFLATVIAPPMQVNLEEIPRGTTFDLLADGATAGESYIWKVPTGYVGDTDKSMIKFNQSGDYQVKITSLRGCVTESDPVRLVYKVEYEVIPELQSDVNLYCLNTENVLDHIVKVKVTVQKADEILPAGTDITMKFKVISQDGAVVSSAEEHYILQNNLTVGNTFEYTFETKARMPKGRNKIQLSTHFDYLGKSIDAEGTDKELLYVSSPTIQLDPSYEDSKPVTLNPIVEGGTPPYTYTWNNVSGNSTYEAEGGMVTLTVSDKNGCSATATTDVRVYHILTITKSGEGSVSIQQFKEDGTQDPADLLENNARIYHGRKLKMSLLPDVSKSYVLDYLYINKQNIPVDKTGKNYEMEVTGNVEVEVSFKKGNDTEVLDAQLAEVVAVSPIGSQLILLHTTALTSYELLNANGVRVATGNNPEQLDKLVIDASNFSAGVYILRIHSEKGQRILRLIKE